ncbi:FtsQ-type POTRA domain-containing protein [Saccharopolyspora rhizosphaerae]|uniref:FtsQ-type POTRA domain-containing protein n=1 Tax=Saccharopolyspora rhizosphaerae TaxID=2492662 RepID=A0A3R8NYQ2_9PSEU|nr:FtsQ-type POTRA domain-containing protein [Saccharopolyspora rhizosphaerae]RRO16083.1 FtsQ-type POTRA domain-containing protein [Saccharopolyspora rhizosphaerae]
MTDRGAAERARRRPVRRSAPPAPAWRRFLLPGLLAVATTGFLVAYFSPLLGVRSVQVEGNDSLPAQEVVRAAEVAEGTPMLQVDPEQIREHLRALAEVADARAVLDWPSTVRIQVTERTPAAYFRATDGVRLLDVSGVPFETVADPPAGVPELRAPQASASDPATRAGLSVLVALPAPVRSEVTAVLAQAPNDIRLELTGGRRVDWGSVKDTPRKAQILPPLLTRPGTIYDVTTPALPTVA